MSKDTVSLQAELVEMLEEMQAMLGEVDTLKKRKVMDFVGLRAVYRGLDQHSEDFNRHASAAMYKIDEIMEHQAEEDGLLKEILGED